jgi:leucyl-tRNA synthetase
VNIGSVEKMSKSKRNTVDPDDIIGTYGADVARWFMLSDSPPERDVEWTEERVQGALRFVQRLWRLVADAAEVAKTAPLERPAEFSPPALAVRKAAHGALAKVSFGIEKLHFNVCLAHIREFANALIAALDEAAARGGAGPDFAWAVKEAADILVQLFHPMMPHLAEECWAALGQANGGGAPSTHARLVAEQRWPEVEPDLLIEDSVTLPVQVNGKRRGEVTVPRDAENSAIEAAVLALDAVKRALDGKAPKKVIVVPQRIVNVVA